MGPFEYHTRYLALRLPIQSNTMPPYNLVSIGKFLLITCIIALSIASTGTANRTSPPWPHLAIGGQADNIISDDRDGSVFLVVNTVVHKYTKELKLLSTTASTTTSSKASASNNETGPNDLVNKLLLIVKNNSPEVLFSCWQTKEFAFKCSINKLQNISLGSPLLWPSESKGFKTGPNDHIKAIVLQSDNNPSDLLIVTSKLTPVEVETNSLPYLPAIGRFKIAKHSTAKHLTLEQKSVIPYKSQLNNFNLLYDYVYLFGYNDHTYFILNDIQKPIDTSSSKEGLSSVRLANICNNDTDLTSYTEISVTCNNHANIYAKSAYFDLTRREPTLYIVFETIDDSNSARRTSEKSHLCSYSMKLIEDVFSKAISDCNNGYQASNLLAKLHSSDSSQPPLCQRNPSNSDEWCTSKTNPYIDGTSYRYNVREDIYQVLDGITSVNLLYTVVQGPDNKDVFFIGTESGYLSKLSHDEDLFYTIDFNSNQVKDYRTGEKFNSKKAFDYTNDDFKGTKYSIDSRTILATSSRGVLNQIDIDACYYYSSCHGCLNTRDPLECVWCGDTCSRKQDCAPNNQSTLSCPPIIKNFFPKVGPTSGWTKLKIEGENFGSPKGNLTVKLGDNECLVNREASTSENIECLTKPMSRPINEIINVTVLDESTYIYSNGSTTSGHDIFAYVNVRIFGLSPASGPHTGGNVSIYGENLNAGTNRSVILGNKECKIIEFQADKIDCRTSSWDVAPTNESIAAQKLKVFIDGHEQLLVPTNRFRNHSLSNAYTPKIVLHPNHDGENVVTVDGIQENVTFSYSTILIISALIIISLLFLFLLRGDKIPQFKIKMPQASESTSDKISDAKVSFRNPQSHKFMHSNSNVGTSSINGLVKLNGSVMSSDYFGKPDQLEQDQPLMNSFLDNEMLSLLVQEKILIDRNRLTLGHVLGSGQFGRVYKGFLKVEETGEHAAVAVKTLHNKSSWDDVLDNRAFLEEGLMMKDFEHDNVLALIGVTFDSNGLPMVITPFMLYGDLRSYISDEASSPTVKELIDFGTQVARGMAYLSGLKFVHRDLAARNCMLDDNLTVKVADFGLSRDIYERDYYSSDNKKTKLPVKWMAIESLEKCIYNTKTDVWSYGILLWELMTRGVVPYPDVDNFDLFSYLKEGRRMLRPRYCPLILYKIMLSCWDENPANRPTFDDLVQKVSDVITQLKIAKDGQQKVSRDMTYCDILK